MPGHPNWSCLSYHNIWEHIYAILSEILFSFSHIYVFFIFPALIPRKFPVSPLNIWPPHFLYLLFSLTETPSKFHTCYSFPLEHLVKYVVLPLLFIFFSLIFCSVRLIPFPCFSFTCFYWTFCVWYLSHSISAPICLSFSSPLPPPSTLPVMRIHCPNPGCLHNLQSSSKPFKNEAGLSIHLSKSPACKAYFLKLSATTTTTPPILPDQFWHSILLLMSSRKGA